MLELRGIGKDWAGRHLVQGLGLEVAAGETVAILGPSGCGKSTLLKIVAGIEPPQSGQVFYDGLLAKFGL